MSHCDFCGIWHSGSCCHPGRARVRELEAERDALRALLQEVRDDWIKVGYGASHEDVAACRDVCDRIDAALAEEK